MQYAIDVLQTLAPYTHQRAWSGLGTSPFVAGTDADIAAHVAKRVLGVVVVIIIGAIVARMRASVRRKDELMLANSDQAASQTRQAFMTDARACDEAASPWQVHPLPNEGDTFEGFASVARAPRPRDLATFCLQALFGIGLVVGVLAAMDGDVSNAAGSLLLAVAVSPFARLLPPVGITSIPMRWTVAFQGVALRNDAGVALPLTWDSIRAVGRSRRFRHHRVSIVLHDDTRFDLYTRSANDAERLIDSLRKISLDAAVQ